MPTYWFDVFTVQTWEEARAQGFGVSGFSETKYATVKRIKQGDILICYLKGVKKLVGALRVTGEPYFSREPRIWANADFPARVAIAPVVTLPPEDGMDFPELLEKLSVYDASNLKSTWARFQGSPTLLQQADGEILFGALEDYQSADTPVRRPLEPAAPPKRTRVLPKPKIEDTVPQFAAPKAVIKVLSDPLSTLVEELTKAQRDVARPARFEQAVADSFTFLGLDATRYGQPNKTDVIVNSQLGHERFRAIIDAKASSSGKVPEGQINWTAVSSHRQQANADYAAIVGEKFAGGNLQRFATDSSISLIETEQLIETLRLHARMPFPAADLRPLFAIAGPVSTVIADLQQKA